MKCENDGQITKFQILVKSGCLTKTILLLFVMIASFVLFYFTFILSKNLIFKIFGVCSIAFLIKFIVIIIKNTFLMIKIMCGKYKIISSKMLDMKRRCIYSAIDSQERILNFNDMNITVDKYIADQFSVGDSVSLVFVNNSKYPIAILKQNNVEDNY